MTITLANGNTIDITPSDSSARYAQLTGDDWVELRWESAEYVEIRPGSSLSFQGLTYTVERPQDITIVHRRDYEYVVRFDSPLARLKYLPFVDPSDGRVSFAVTGNAGTHLQMLVSGINAVSDVAWSVGNTPTATEEKTISYDSMTLHEALELVAETFGMEFEVIGTALYLRRVEYNKATPLALKYGYGNGLKSGIHRANNGDFPPVLAAVAKGGNRNINTSSNQGGYGSKTLHMPGPGVVNGIPNIIAFDGEKYAYLDGYSSGTYHYDEESGFSSADAKYYIITNDGHFIKYAGRDGQLPTMPAMTAGTKMDIIDLTHIYPQKEHTVTAVTSQQKTAQAQDGTTETYQEYTIEFATDIDYHAAMIPGSSSLTVIFQTGMLAGREFDANFVQPWQTGDAGKFVVISKFIDDERMPGGLFIPAAGDKFRVFNCMLPQQYIRDDSDWSGAEWDMAREAARYMYTYGEEHYTWEADLSTVFAHGMTAAQFAKVRIGGYVSFTDLAVQVQPLLIRITELKQPLNHPRRVEIKLEEYTRLRWGRRKQIAGDSAQRINSSGVSAEVSGLGYSKTHSPSYSDLSQSTSACVKTISFDGTNYTPVSGLATLPSIKTINGQQVVGSGDIVVNGADEKLAMLYVTSSTYNVTYGSNRAMVFVIKDGIASVAVSLNDTNQRIPFRIIIDNNSNTSDVRLTFSIKYNGSLPDVEYMAPALKDARGYLLKAGDTMELEHLTWNLNNQVIGVLGLVFGSV